MKLEVNLTIQRKPTRSSTLECITIRLGPDRFLELPLLFPLNFSKFKRSPARIIRELKKRAGDLRINFSCDKDRDSGWWYSYANMVAYHTLWIDSTDLASIKMGYHIKSVVYSALNRTISKEYTRKPSKPKSDMEYRKRAYYGKCKR